MGACMTAVFVIPVAAGILQPVLKIKNRKNNLALIAAVLAAEAVLAIVLAVRGAEKVTWFRMSDTLTIALRVDDLSKIFLVLFSLAYLLIAFYAFDYLAHREEGSHSEYFFYCFYLCSEGAILTLVMAENLVTMYLFFEATTLLSMPLVLFDRTQTSVNAALKYMYYSIAGAFMGLACIVAISRYADTLAFQEGGVLSAEASQNSAFLLAMIFIGVLGFGAKAGMYPLHGWLPTAHPAAPAPASALLSGVIAKIGVFAIIRLLYYIAGPSFVAGTWVQKWLMGIALFTVFAGSVTACGEQVLKRRLAYSSVSQISYALFGIFLLTPEGLAGSLLQVLYHAMAKICLFLTAGSVICCTGKTSVRDMAGFGKKMPKTFIAYTLASLSLIGIPPFGGFVSKWFLAEGALDSGMAVYSWLGPVVLILSALLTAFYLLPVAIRAFFPGRDFVLRTEIRGEGSAFLWMPLLILGALLLVLGLFAQPLAQSFLQLGTTVCG